MVFSLAAAWRLALAIAFCAAIFMSACARAPRQAVPGTELRRLVASALILYGVGGLASLTHHELLADLVYGAGIMVSALAAWLSRGRDQEDPPGDDEPEDEHPPPSPTVSRAWTGRPSNASSAPTPSATAASRRRRPDAPMR